MEISNDAGIYKSLAFKQLYSEVWCGTNVQPTPTILYCPCRELRACVTCLKDVVFFMSIKDAAAWLTVKRLATESQMWGIIETAEAEAERIDGYYDVLLNTVHDLFKQCRGSQ